MVYRPGTVQRAFELALNSPLVTVEQIRRRLKAEGYSDWEFQLSGRSIRKQLQALVVAKRARAKADAEIQAQSLDSAFAPGGEEAQSALG